MKLDIKLIYPDGLLRLDAVSQKALKIAMQDARRVLLRRVKSGTPRDTGRLWGSWQAVSDARGVTVSTDVYYAPYVEKGGPPGSGKGHANWPRVGPRTVSSQGRVWSRQAVEGMIAPILADDQWWKDISTTIVEVVRREIA